MALANFLQRRQASGSKSSRRSEPEPRRADRRDRFREADAGRRTDVAAG